MSRFIKSLTHAFDGFTHLFKTQRNFRIQLIIGFIVLFFAILYQLDDSDLLWIIFSVFIVWILEGVNTLIEELSDLLEPRFNTKVKVIKDVAASVVLFGASMTIFIGLNVFGRAIFGFSSIYTFPFGIIIVVLVFLISRGGVER
ncbi:MULTISPECIES: diacylglycerol kinase family protein [Kosmotoga]|uniref:Diacylglycerol kinase n=1 Tax=Kosmotoga olearia (strain ATCC BAA-1733 / DSM 21960 / TBF 19.5.1) TaxID=521045 RepID=C5CDF9_KOSOT|nr:MULTISPECIES: diacylglycerol kinase family protein [Kosmotoga]ACR79043.1 diacylglycerol kinase [Kosmotoga olearia TBF 19.5.1]OAA23751.1 hypothetical protein DU53_01545 [Kosmotoga sp. DU53]